VRNLVRRAEASERNFLFQDALRDLRIGDLSDPAVYETCVEMVRL
jgi:hypothetical protein